MAHSHNNSGGGVSNTFTRVMFTVRAETHPGQCVHLSGDTARLGNFRPNRAMELITTPEDYPIWTTPRPLMLPSGQSMQYKYVLFAGGEFDGWEPIRAHARVVLPTGLELTMDDTFGVCDETELQVSMPESIGDVQLRDFDTESDSASTASASTASASLTDSLMHQPSGTATHSSGISCGPGGGVLTAAEDSARRLAMRLFIVSFHLPVTLLRDDKKRCWTAVWNRDSLIAKTESSVAEDHPVIWIGGITPHCLNSDTASPFNLDEATKREIIEVLQPMNCVPVFLEQHVYEQHYTRFCKKTLWKVFHNVLDVNDDLGEGLEGDSVFTAYDGYSALNKTFAEVVLDSLAAKALEEREQADVLKREQEREGEGGDSFALPSMLNCVWVHDYHLMLVPNLVTSKESLATRKLTIRPRVVFFMHLPFPTSEIFRTLSMRSELLAAVLSADVVGFHTFDHARHFLTACKRFLGYTHQMRKGGTLCVDRAGHSVLIAVSHIGVEPQRLERVMANRAVQKAAATIRETHKGKVIVAGLDELQRLKGVPLKLLAFEQLLYEYPRFREEVVLVQWCVETGKQGRVNDLAKSAAEVKELVKRICTEFGPVVDYKQWPASASPTLSDRVALWSSADVMISTPVMEGLNLLPLEYQYVHREPAGVVIVSDFSACSRVLNGALRVNCYDASKIAIALDQAIVMSKREREGRRNRDLTYISERPASVWTRNVLELAVPKSEEENVFTAIMNDHYQAEETLENHNASDMACPVSRPHTMDMAECKELDRAAVVRSFRKSARRVVLLDYGGTIVPRELNALTMKRGFFGVSSRKISPELTAKLKTLATDENTCLCIVSGNSRRVLSDAFHEVIITPNARLAIVAHSGLCIRWVGNHADLRTSTPELRESVPDGTIAKTGGSSSWAGSAKPRRGSAEHEDQWETMLSGVSDEWGEWMEAANVPEIMNEYTARTGGSVWRQTSVTTTWDYRQSDPEWGDMQANHLQTALETSVRAINLPVVVLRKMNIVQILPKGVSKGTAVRHIMERLPRFTGWGKKEPDFAICIGDDLADERMFTELMGSLGESADAHLFRPFHHGSWHEPHEESLRDVYTVTVGRKPTEARYYLRDAHEVARVLDSLSSVVAHPHKEVGPSLVS